MNEAKPRLIERKIPLITTVKTYKKEFLVRDIIAGLTVAIVAIPQALSYANIAGLEKYLYLGLYTVIISVIIAAIFGSSNFLIAGTTNAVALLILSNMSKFSAQENFLELLFLMTFMVGVIQILFSVFRLGKALNFVSHSVIVGFTAGAGVLIAFGQLNGLLGIKTPGDLHSSQEKFIYVLQHLSSTNLYALGVGVFTMVIILVLKKIHKRLPGSLIAIVIMGAVVVFFGLDKLGVKLTGDIPTGLPPFKMINFNLDMILQVLNASIIIAVIALVEAMAIAKSLASKAEQKLDTNQEILAQGLANAGGSFFQCYAGTGSFTRSAVNYISGAATRFSGILSGVFVAMILLFFGQFAKYIPGPGLAGVILLIAYGMIDKAEIKKILNFGRSDMIALIVTMVATIILPEVSWAVGVGVAASIILYLKNTRCKTVKISLKEQLNEETKEVDVITIDLEGKLYFVAASKVETALESIETKAKIYILRIRNVTDIDITILEVLKTFIDKIENADRDVIICGVNEEINKIIQRFHLIQKIDPSKVFMAEKKLFSSYEKALIKADEIVYSIHKQEKKDNIDSFEGIR